MLVSPSLSHVSLLHFHCRIKLALQSLQHPRLFHIWHGQQRPIMRPRLKRYFIREPSMSNPQKNGPDPWPSARILLPSPLFVP